MSNLPKHKFCNTLYALAPAFSPQATVSLRVDSRAPSFIAAADSDQHQSVFILYFSTVEPITRLAAVKSS